MVRLLRDKAKGMELKPTVVSSIFFEEKPVFANDDINVKSIKVCSTLSDAARAYMTKVKFGHIATEWLDEVEGSIVIDRLSNLSKYRNIVHMYLRKHFVIDCI